MDSLYSRQVGTIGKNAMAKLLKLKILIIGCDTIGVECAKSLALMGVKKLYLFDNTIYNTKHYGRLIYKSKSKKKLSVLCKEFLAVLNPQLEVEILGSLNRTQLQDFKMAGDLDGIVQTSTKAIENIEKIALNLNIPYMLGVNHALLGYVFVNFNKWQVDDPDGETLITGYVDSFTSIDDIVLELNDIKKRPISNLLTLNSGNKIVSTEALEIKLIIDKVMNMSKLVIKLNSTPELLDILTHNNVLYSETKEVATHTHMKFTEQPTDNYQHIKLNTSFSRNDELYTNYRKFIKTEAMSDYPFKDTENITTKFYVLGTIIGNILASEVMKITGKYTPLNQDILFDYTGLNSSNKYSSEHKFYDTHRLLDRDLLKILKKQSVFMVGCGALGCEISKNLAMMGFSSFKRSALTITDMDTIELSNLNRQFLYQQGDIGKLKSEVLKKKLNKYCPDIKVNSFNMEVGKTSETTFNKAFWQGSDLVINALDNVEARKYVDQQCVLHDKPLFESGTLGQKANTQSIIPYKTATYSEIKDPVDDSIPMCTIRNFPNKIEHCVEWSLSIFNKIFTEALDDLDKLENVERLLIELRALNNDAVILERLNNLTSLHKFLENVELYRTTKQPINFEGFIKYGIYLYKTYYYKPIINILETFPENLSNGDGTKFWSGKKLKPKLNDVDILDKSYFRGIIRLIDGSLVSEFDSWLMTVHLPDVLKTNLLQNTVSANKLVVDEKSDKTSEVIDEKELECAVKELKNIKKLETTYRSIVYDKDVDAHIDVMESIVNLRANTYQIRVSDKLKIKIISGKIIPALSTTTSVIAGFVILDILKYLSSNKLKHTEVNINLGINNYSVYDALKPGVTHNNMFSKEYSMKIKTIPVDFTTWSKIKIKGKKDMVTTIPELIRFLKVGFEIKPNILMCGNDIIYNSLNATASTKTTLKTIYNNMDKQYKEYIFLDVCMYSDEGIPIITPPIIYSCS